MTADRRRSPLGDLADALDDHNGRWGGRLAVTELPYLSLVNVRTFAGTAPVSVAGIALPAVAGTVARAGDVAALWLGPDEWLVVGWSGVDGQDEGWTAVDVSAQLTTLELTGPAARAVLAHGCALDLDRLGSDRCAQTMVALANVILWTPAPDRIHLLVRASFARYLVTWLIDAASELSGPPQDLDDHEVWWPTPPRS